MHEAEYQHREEKPPHALIPCGRVHYWCHEHRSEVCTNAKSLTVKHAECKLVALDPHPSVKR